MNRSRKLYAALGGIGMLALLGLAIPQAAHAVSAALVQVVNTAANPVIIEDRDSEARGAFQTSVDLSLSGTSGVGVSIPPGTRLVIDYVSVAGAGPSAGTQPYVILYSNVGVTPQATYTLTPTQSTLAPQQFQHTEAVKIYADSLFVSLAFSGSTPPFLTFHVTISGHLVTVP
jgi:hypothetical protein